MASIHPHKTKWRVRWELPPDPVTGKRRQTSRVVDTEPEAQALAAQVEADLDDGSWTDPRRLRFDHYTEQWLERASLAWKPATLDFYRAKIRNTLPHIGHHPLTRLDGMLLTGMYQRLLKTHSPRTVHHVHRALRKCLGDAVKWRLLTRNPALEAVPPRVVKKAPKAWTAAQLARFLEHTQGDRLHPLWRVVATCALRRGELFGLTWDRVTDTHLEVSATLVEVDGQLIWQDDPKTRSGRRRIALDTETAAALDQLRRLVESEKAFMGDTYQDNNLVFCREDGTTYRPSFVGKQFKRIVTELRLPAITLHGLRHTWATLALSAGVPMKVVSDRLGHSSIGVTADVYTGHVAALDVDAAEAVADLLGGTDG